MNSTLLKLVLKPTFKWAAHRALVGKNRSTHEPEKGRFTRAEVHGILDQLWRNFDELAPDIPHEPTYMSRITVRLACVTLSFYRALLAAGVEKDYAITLFADNFWLIYEKLNSIQRLYSRVRTRDPVKRISICINLLIRLIMTPPGYLFKRLPADDGISLDMLRCPTAEYLRSYGAAEDLCVSSFCNLDYPMAEFWGGWLERAETLAAGGDCCSYRFKAKPLVKR